MIIAARRWLVASCIIALPVVIESINSTSADELRCSKQLPSAALTLLESNFNSWTILEYDQLSRDDQELWRETWGTKCPGVAVGHFDGGANESYAVVIRGVGDDSKHEKLLIMKKNRASYTFRILTERSRVPNHSVVYTVPPGRYHDFYNSTATVVIPNEGFVYATLEATATLFYFKTGKCRKLLISD